MARVSSWDTKDFEAGLKKLDEVVVTQTVKAVRNVAEDVLRLSQKEVPHDIGTLQNSGHVEHTIGGDPYVSEVGYFTPYAHRLHEHPEYHFKKGRKGKYLEDPLKNNLPYYLEKYGMIIGEVL